MRYLRDRPFTHKHRDCVRVVHSGVGQLIRDLHAANRPAPSAAPAPAPAPNAAPAAAHPPPPSVAFRQDKHEVDAHHHTFQVGDPVRVKSALKAYAEFVGATGVVRSIVQGHIYFFCVLFDFPLQCQAVTRLNALHVNTVRFRFIRPDEGELL